MALTKYDFIIVFRHCYLHLTRIRKRIRDMQEKTISRGDLLPRRGDLPSRRGDLLFRRDDLLSRRVDLPSGRGELHISC